MELRWARNVTWLDAWFDAVFRIACFIERTFVARSLSARKGANACKLYIQLKNKAFGETRWARNTKTRSKNTRIVDAADHTRGQGKRTTQELQTLHQYDLSMEEYTFLVILPILAKGLLQLLFEKLDSLQTSTTYFDCIYTEFTF